MSTPRRMGVPAVGVTIAASLVVRLVFAAALGFGVDEAYAVSVARPFSSSYFDHPPLHFWVVGAMADLTGSVHPFVLRLPFVAMFCGTLWAVADVTRRYFGEDAARIAAVALAMSGVLGLTSATWVLPDGPLLCASAIAVWALSHVLGGDDVAAPPDAGALRRWWSVAGAAFALAALSKYHAVLLVSGVGLFMLSDRSARRQLLTPWPWLALALVVLSMLPVVAWNATHDWVSFRFHGARATADHWSPAPFAEMLMGQTAWLLPWVAIPLASAAFAARRRWATERAPRLLLCVAAVPVLFFSCIPLGGARALPHWTAPGWLFVFPLLGGWAASGLRSGREDAALEWPRWLGVGAIATAALLLLVIAQAQWSVLDSWLDASARDRDPTRDGVSWTPAVDPTADVLLVRSWIQGGQAGSARGAVPRVVCLCADPHHFRYRAGVVLRAGERGLLLERLRTRPPDVPAEALGGDSLRITARDTVLLDRGVRIARYDVTRRTLATRLRAAW